VHLVPVEAGADLVGGDVEGGVASGSLDGASRLRSTLARDERGVREADRRAEVGGGEAAKVRVQRARMVVGEGGQLPATVPAPGAATQAPTPAPDTAGRDGICLPDAMPEGPLQSAPVKGTGYIFRRAGRAG
jgi:hypothetical protein